jgi:hypothetical protein
MRLDMLLDGKYYYITACSNGEGGYIEESEEDKEYRIRIFKKCHI